MSLPCSEAWGSGSEFVVFTNQCSSYTYPCAEGGGKKGTMSERQNTLVCAFDQHNSRITAYDIHEWIHDTLCLREDDVAMIKIDDPRRHVYIKFSRRYKNAGITDNQMTRGIAPYER
jgi:hypothetical protein